LSKNSKVINQTLTRFHLVNFGFRTIVKKNQIDLKNVSLSKSVIKRKYLFEKIQVVMRIHMIKGLGSHGREQQHSK
jgi:hypothetical protein